jgi:subtilisin family serine protease
MDRARGSPEVVIALVDGPVAVGMAALRAGRISEVSGAPGAACATRDSYACQHGTFVAAILIAERGSPAPAICPDCTLLVYPVFPEATEGPGAMSYATPEELAAAIAASVSAGARIINLSLAVIHATTHGERELGLALDMAARRGVIVIAAAGNQRMVGSSALTRHPWVIPVAACDQTGAPLGTTNLAPSIGRRGLAALGAGVVSLTPDGRPRSGGGTSVAAPFISGASALLWSEHLGAPAAAVRRALLSPHTGRRPGIVPPLLDASRAYEFLQRARW